MANVAGNVNVGQEVHGNFQNAVAAAGFTAPALDVETEPAGTVAANFGALRLGEKISNAVENLGVGYDVGARRTPNRVLVDFNHGVDAVFSQRVGVFYERGINNFVDERGFAGAADAGYERENFQRNFNVEVVNVICADIFKFEKICGSAAAGRHWNFFAPAEIIAGQRFWIGGNFVGGALRDNFAAIFTGAAPNVNEHIGFAHGFFVVFDYQQSVAEVAQIFERLQKFMVIVLVKSNRRLVEYVQHAG